MNWRGLRLVRYVCKWGTDVPLRLKVPAYLSYTGIERWKTVGVDACMAPLISALHCAGIETVASCCGHGRTHGRIDLADGRVLFVVTRHV
jgi:hypothetical protein